METIGRKALLYRSGLGFWCVNHVLGCSHGCAYPCYAFNMARAHGRAKTMADWTRPRLVRDAAALLARELDRKRTLPDRIHFCLTTDPFMHGWPEVTEATLALVEVANARGVPCSLLTKGELPADLADRARFPEANLHGASLVSLDEGFRARWEPGAAPYAERLAALRKLHEAGLATRIHIEPYPTPNIIEHDLETLLEAVSFVDSLYFGRWNYSAAAGRFPDADGFYARCEEKARNFCARQGIAYEA